MASPACRLSSTIDDGYVGPTRPLHNTWPIHIGPNIHVSADLSGLPHYEITMASDPNDASRLFVCSNANDPAHNGHWVASYRSEDGGMTWQRSLDGRSTKFVGDPTCAYGPDGVMVAVFLALEYEKKDGEHAMNVYRSTDSGESWSDATVLPFMDREWVAFDHTDGAHHGRMYIGGAGVDHGPEVRDSVTVYRSDDNGATFAPPAELEVPENRGLSGMSHIAVLSDGTVVIAAHERHTDIPLSTGAMTVDMRIYTSTDGGVTFPGRVIATTRNTCSTGETLVPSLAVDETSGPFKDRIYLLYLDGSSGRCKVMLVTSSDKGESWSAPKEVSDDGVMSRSATEPNHTMPSVCVNKDGVVGVLWYDRRDVIDDGWMPRFAASFDGGESFLPSVPISDEPYRRGPDEAFYPVSMAMGGGFPRGTRGEIDPPLSVRVEAFYTYNAGHTGGMTADANGVFHPIWIDNRTNVPQVWTSAVRVNGKAHRFGDSSLDGLDDITDRVTLFFSNSRYDPTTRMVTIDAQLCNTSDQPIRGPIKLRVLDVTAPWGDPVMLTTDNQHNAAGAIWDFTPLIGDDTLDPWERSKAKTLRFRIDNYQFQSDAGGTLVNVNALAYGRSSS